MIVKKVENDDLEICRYRLEIFDQKNTTRLIAQILTIQIDRGVEDVEERVHDFLKKKKRKEYFEMWMNICNLDPYRI